MTKISTAGNIYLSDQAENLYKDWFNANAEISNSEYSGYLKGVYGKLGIIALRVAVVIYGMHLYNGGKYSNQISDNEMAAAINITEYFRATALKVYCKLFDNNIEPSKKEIIKYWSVLGNSQTKIAEVMNVTHPYVCKVLK